jgi:hypothetical protein
MSTWVNAADPDCTLGLNRRRPDTVLCRLRNQKIYTRRAWPHLVGIAEGVKHWIRAASFGFSALMRTGKLPLNLGGSIQHSERVISLLILRRRA